MRIRKPEEEEITRFLQRLMGSGKKTTVQRIFRQAMQIIEKDQGYDPTDVLVNVLRGLMPKVRYEPTRVRGGKYKVPVEVITRRQLALATRRILASVRGREERTIAERLAAELVAKAETLSVGVTDAYKAPAKLEKAIYTRLRRLYIHECNETLRTIGSKRRFILRAPWKEQELYEYAERVAGSMVEGLRERRKAIHFQFDTDQQRKIAYNKFTKYKYRQLRSQLEMESKFRAKTDILSHSGIVPMGEKIMYLRNLGSRPCAYCRIVAANSPYTIEQASSLGSIMHPNCRCEWMSTWDEEKEPYIEKAYRRVKKQARKRILKIEKFERAIPYIRRIKERLPVDLRQRLERVLFPGEYLDDERRMLASIRRRVKSGKLRVWTGTADTPTFWTPQRIVQKLAERPGGWATKRGFQKLMLLQDKQRWESLHKIVITTVLEEAAVEVSGYMLHLLVQEVKKWAALYVREKYPTLRAWDDWLTDSGLRPVLSRIIGRVVREMFEPAMVAKAAQADEPLKFVLSHAFLEYPATALAGEQVDTARVIADATERKAYRILAQRATKTLAKRIGRAVLHEVTDYLRFVVQSAIARKANPILEMSQNQLGSFLEGIVRKYFAREAEYLGGQIMGVQRAKQRFEYEKGKGLDMAMTQEPRGPFAPQARIAAQQLPYLPERLPPPPVPEPPYQYLEFPFPRGDVIRIIDEEARRVLSMPRPEGPVPAPIRRGPERKPRPPQYPGREEWPVIPPAPPIPTRERGTLVKGGQPYVIDPKRKKRFTRPVYPSRGGGFW